MLSAPINKPLDLQRLGASPHLRIKRYTASWLRSVSRKTPRKQSCVACAPSSSGLLTSSTF
jgi:hypothetical protein